jgi:hypothetical protein
MGVLSDTKATGRLHFFGYGDSLRLAQGFIAAKRDRSDSRFDNPFDLFHETQRAHECKGDDIRVWIRLQQSAGGSEQRCTFCDDVIDEAQFPPIRDYVAAAIES